MESDSKIVSIEKKPRIEFLDLAKGIGIILVVWAHAKGPYGSYIYQMHMPFFFIISGLLYNEATPVKEYILKKIKSLYIPFVFWNLLIYLTKAIIRGYGFKAILRETALIAATLTKDGEFLGATWFLGSLFVVCVSYKILDRIIKESKYKSLIVMLIGICIAVLGFCINLPLMTSRTLVLTPFFILGVLVKKHKDYLRNYTDPVTAMMCGFAFLTMGAFGKVNMGANEYHSPILFVVGALMASYALLYLCKVIEEKQKVLLPVKRFVKFLGRRSMDIMIWQFVFFRLVIFVQLAIYGKELTLENLLSYYPCYITSNGWWIAYLVVGILVPIAFCSLLRLGFWGKAFKKIHIV